MQYLKSSYSLRNLFAKIFWLTLLFFYFIRLLFLYIYNPEKSIKNK